MPQRSVASNYTFEQQRAEINLLAADFWTQKTAVDGASSSYLKHDGSNDFTGASLAVPNAFSISPVGPEGTVTISGNLNVSGTTTTVQTTNLDVTDKNIKIAKGNANDATADGAGLTIDSGTDITWNFVNANAAWVSSIGVEATTFVKAPYGQFTGSGTPTTGQGVEINAPDTSTGQIISYDRGNTLYKDLRLKGSTVGVYTGTSNALAGTFNSTGLVVEGEISVGTSTGGKTLTLYGADDSSFRISKSGVLAYDHTFDGSTYKIENNNGSAGIPIVIGTKTAGAESLRITEDGKLLVGTSTEGSSGVDNLILYRNGNGGITIRNDANQNGNIYFSRGTSGTDEYKGYIQYQHAQDLMVFGTGHEEKLRLKSTAQSELEIYCGDTDENYAVIRGKYSDSNEYNRSEVRFGVQENANGRGFLAFATGNNSATEALRITWDGNVGINNDNPTVKLAVDGGTVNNATVVQIKNDSNSAYTTGDGGLNTALSVYSDGTDSAQGVGIQFYLQKTGVTGCISEIGATRESTGNSTLVFRTRDSSVGVGEKARITSGGLLLLGTTDTGFSNGYTTMTIGNTSTQNTGLTIAASSTDGYSRLHFADGNSGTARYAGWIAYDHADDAMKFSTANSGSSKLILNSDGYVGIGTSLPDKTGIQNNVKVLQLDGGDGAELILGNSVSANVSVNHIGAIAFKNIDTSTGSAPHYAGIRSNCVDTSGNMNLKFYGGGGDGTGFETDDPDMLIDAAGEVAINETSPVFGQTNGASDFQAGDPKLGVKGSIGIANYSSTVTDYSQLAFYRRTKDEPQSDGSHRITSTSNMGRIAWYGASNDTSFPNYAYLMQCVASGGDWWGGSARTGTLQIHNHNYEVFRWSANGVPTGRSLRNVATGSGMSAWTTSGSWKVLLDLSGYPTNALYMCDASMQYLSAYTATFWVYKTSNSTYQVIHDQDSLCHWRINGSQLELQQNSGADQTETTGYQKIFMSIGMDRALG